MLVHLFGLARRVVPRSHFAVSFLCDIGICNAQTACPPSRGWLARKLLDTPLLRRLVSLLCFCRRVHPFQTLSAKAELARLEAADAAAPAMG